MNITKVCFFSIISELLKFLPFRNKLKKKATQSKNDGEDKTQKPVEELEGSSHLRRSKRNSAVVALCSTEVGNIQLKVTSTQCKCKKEEKEDTEQKPTEITEKKAIVKCDL